MSERGKILFIIHDVYQDDNELPLGPAYLASVLRQNGYKVDIFCQDVFHQSNKELGEYLEENDYDIIGLGFLAARYTETIRPLVKIIIEHKKGAKLILGGHGPSAIPEYILDDTKADVVFRGEAEETIVPVCDLLINGGDLTSQDGIAYRDEGGQIKVNLRASPVRNLDKIPFPAWDLFPLEKYLNCFKLPGSDFNDKTLSVITSRGCVNKCSFCYRLETGIRIRSIKNIYDELFYLNSKLGVSYFIFNDEMFLSSRQRIAELTSMFKNLKTKVKYYCQARVELAKDKKILKMLADSGCQLLNLGLESLDQNVLNLMNKRTRVEDNYMAVENTIEAGIHPGLNFLWANHGDTKESLDKIVDFLIKYDTLGQLRTIRPPTPYPGCPLYYKVIEEGKLKDAADFFDKFKNSDRLTVNFTNLTDYEIYSALLDANSKLIRNYYVKRSRPAIEAEAMIDNFRRLYFPKDSNDLQFRGARHYNKVDGKNIFTSEIKSL